MNKRARVILVTLIGAVACYFAVHSYMATKCPSDYSILLNFSKNENRLNHLLAMLESDDERVSYVGRGVVSSIGPPLGPEREMEYLTEVKNVGAISLTHNVGETTLWFWDSSTSILSSSRSKGLAMFPDINRHRYYIKTKLDGLEKNNTDGIYVMPLTKNWYIIYIQSS